MPSASARSPIDSHSAHRQGESAAQTVLAEALVHRPMSVTYGSRGRVLVLGPEAEAKAAAVRLQDVGLQTDMLADGRESVALQGHLGDFRVVGPNPDQPDADVFDLVLDLSRPPLLAMELTPPGYFAPGDDPQRLDDALAELPELVGEFDKPRFFSYDPSICAHGARGLTGCTRCLDACPTLAIRDLGERIEIDPYRCQGGGSCATVCPTGAVRYDCPPPSVLLTALRHALRAYREIAPERPVLLLHGSEAGRAWLDSLPSGLPEPVIPTELEEVGSAGLETWLCALAFGAASVALLITGETPPSVRGALAAEVALGREILEALGYPAQALRMLEADGCAASVALAAGEGLPADLPAAGFQSFDEKHTNLYLALDHLWRHAPRRSERTALPEGSPFGAVDIDTRACTLCMSCVAVCPAKALNDGGGTPRLDFVQGNCVQCGLCVTACPEDALTLRPEMVFDPELRRRPRVLHEEQPFCCVSCGKPFATQAMIRAITGKLAAHWMYQDERALRRLQMCDACRVRDLLEEGMP